MSAPGSSPRHSSQNPGTYCSPDRARDLWLQLLKVGPVSGLGGPVVIEAAAGRGGLACRADIAGDLGERGRVAGPADDVHRQICVLTREQHVVAGVLVRAVLQVASRAAGGGSV